MENAPHNWKKNLNWVRVGVCVCVYVCVCVCVCVYGGVGVGVCAFVKGIFFLILKYLSL